MDLGWEMGWNYSSLLNNLCNKYSLWKSIGTNNFFLLAATAIVKTNHTQNHASVVVFQMPRSASLTWAERRPPLRNFLSAFILCPMNMNSSAPRPWKQDVFAPTNILLNAVVKISSSFEWDFIHSMSFVSTRCCHVLELIGELNFKLIF